MRRLEPHDVSWLAVRGSDDFTRLLDYDLTWRDTARRFEFITLPFQDFVGMNASLELFHELGPREVAAHITCLADQIVQWAERHGVELVTPSARDRRGGIIAVRPPDARAASGKLREARVTHSLREGAIRLSPHAYNTSAEIRLRAQHHCALSIAGHRASERRGPARVKASHCDTKRSLVRLAFVALVLLG